jgi:hypothetical protein
MDPGTATTVVSQTFRALVDVVDLIVTVVSIVRVVRLERARLRHGRWSKAFWIVTAIVVTWSLGPISVPVGALEALARTRSLGAGPTGVGLADGQVWTPPV